MSISTPPGWNASPLLVTSLEFGMFPQQFTGTHLFTEVERSTMRVKFIAQEHNTMSLARARTRSTSSGVKHTNHKATDINKTDLDRTVLLCMRVAISHENRLTDFLLLFFKIFGLCKILG